MSILRFLSVLILVLCFVSTGPILAEKSHKSIKSSYMWDGDKVWYTKAKATSTHQNDAGWFRVWAHCGSGTRDYDSGNYQGILRKRAFSKHVTSPDGDQPSPYFASSYNR